MDALARELSVTIATAPQFDEDLDGLEGLEALLTKWKGKESELLSKMKMKYKVSCHFTSCVDRPTFRVDTRIKTTPNESMVPRHLRESIH